jgi:allantoin racemase
VGELLGRVKRAEEDGYDAVIIGCSSDPGLYLAKRLSRIPVVGPLEAGLHTASILTQRTVVITAGTWAEVRWLEDRARLYGLHHQITSIRRIRVDRPTDAELGGWMLHQPEKARQALLRSYERAVSVPGVAASQIQAAIEEEGIESVYFACTFFSGMLDPLRQEFRIPMLDPALGALRVAEMLVKAGRGILYGGHENA